MDSLNVSILNRHKHNMRKEEHIEKVCCWLTNTKISKTTLKDSFKMIKSWFLLSVSFCSVLIQCHGKHAEVSSKFYNARTRRNTELEETLSRLRSLLNDPIDEEHDDLERESDDTHAHEWTLQITDDDDKVAEKLANKYGFDHYSRVSVGPGVYRFSHDTKKFVINSEDNSAVDEPDVSKVISKREHLEGIEKLLADEKVRWYKRERILSREKKTPDSDAKQETSVNDPKFEHQWYIRNTGQTAGPASSDGKAFDSNILPVWDMGYTGKGVTLSVLDDGMDHTHPELVDNYDAKASNDLNGHDPDPMPNDADPYNAHGTKCAGTIAAKANNSLCGVGIAFDAKIGAIRMLDGKATDGLEANALSFHRDYIDIYSCSWGPKDNGQTFGRPGRLGRIALAQGAKDGRKGLGSLFIWATGNGGTMSDDCNADGYVNSIYTLGIGSVNEHGVSTYYGEKCPAMMAVTYCSGQHKNSYLKDVHANVITTFLHHECTNHFVGTSSAAPLAASIFALVLQANPRLTWRDMQHLVFHTAKKTSPLDLGWSTNGCGKPFNHKFGFGVLDAYLLVKAALNWTTVEKQKSCHFNLNFVNGDIPSRHHFKLNFTTDGCQNCKNKQKDGTCKNGIAKLEHVVVNITLKHRRRGDLSIDLISPSGTVSHMLHVRPFDSSSSGLKGWSFMTLFNWCENPKGTWQLVFYDNKPVHPFSNGKKRDMEQEYIQMLDKRKKADLEKRRQSSPEKSDDVTTNAEEQVYGHDDETAEKLKREFHAFQNARDDERSRAHNSYKREENQYEDYNRDVDDDPYRRVYNGRYRRDTDENIDKTDYMLYKRKDASSYEYGMKNKVLSKGLLAGVVQSISVTFYGTS